MLVLIGVAPAGFVVNMNATGYEITRTRDAINNVEAYFEQHPALLKQATGADSVSTGSGSWRNATRGVPLPSVEYH